MKITHLRHFIAVAEELHLVRAAVSLGISRAKLNSSIRALESEVGCNLFDRRQESTTLTRAGVALLDITPRSNSRNSMITHRLRMHRPGGKAKALKGTGRAPIVKGEPRQSKNRQSR